MHVSISSREIERTHGLDTTHLGNYVISFLACALAAIAMATFFEDLFHWFLIPVVLCGALIGSDTIEWFKKGTDTFDPIAIFGLYGVYFFFVAPILHVMLDYWMKYVTPPRDWRPWLGYMALLNLLGLMLMIWARNRYLTRVRKRTPKRIWIINNRKLLPVLLLFLIVSFSLQVYIYASRGGIMGYIKAYTEGQTDVFQGLGLIFMISESFPILALIGFALYAKGNKVLSSWLVLIPIILIYIILQVIFGGLRGSRSNTLFMIIWAVGIIHFWIRPVSKKMIILGLAFMLVFMYFYGFYKGAGLEITEILRTKQIIPILEKKTGRDTRSLLLGDLSRADVQAFILYRISGNSDYRLALGRSYVGDISILIPKQLWPNRPPTKVKEGTEVAHGMGSYFPDRLKASNVYGMSGEAMLNFGPLFLLITFPLLGLFLGLVGRGVMLQENDSRMILLPIVLIFPIIFLVSDLDNVIFFLVKQITIPLIFLAFITEKRFVEKPFINSLYC